jgi:hypothetical protein
MIPNDAISPRRYMSAESTGSYSLPPNPPAALFWSITIYNPTDGTMIKYGQPFPSINSLDGRVTANDDGSFDVHLGPQRPDGVSEANWLHTNPGEGYPLNLRLYGPTQRSTTDLGYQTTS